MEVVSTTLVTVTKLGIDLSVFITSYLDEIVPVHDRSYLVLESIGLLNFLIGRCDDSLVLHLLTGSLSTVV